MCFGVNAIGLRIRKGKGTEWRILRSWLLLIVRHRADCFDHGRLLKSQSKRCAAAFSFRRNRQRAAHGLGDFASVVESKAA